jgi:2,3-diketo-5-methylthio-1-phosphopentane phosphatase
MTTTGANSANGKLTPAFLTDFDDTAAVQNVAELLLNRFGDPSWTDVRQQFRDGVMNLKEYQEITFRNIRADRSAMQHYVREHATLRPYFNELHYFCRSHDIPLAVVSQGLDFYISALLQRDGFTDVPIFSVNTRFDAGNISYEYNHAYPGQESKGNSKGFVVESYQKQGFYVVYAGDGLSDLEASRKADLVFAHRTLARYCDEEGIPYRPFEDFKGVLLAVREMAQ